MAYLSELHPEVYLASPRPGGLANIVPPRRLSDAEPRSSKISGKGSRATRSLAGKSIGSAARSSVRSYQRGSIGAMSGRSSLRSTGASTFDSSFMAAANEKNNREYRIQQVLHTSQWMPECKEDIGDSSLESSDPMNISMIIASIAISTMMLIAVGHKDIPQDHLRWTLSYLECVKDEYGVYPPNVRAMINHLKLIDNTLESFLETEIDQVMLDAGTDAVIQEHPAAEAAPTEG